MRKQYTGSKKPVELLAKLRRAPESRVGEAELAVRRQLVLALVATLNTLVREIKTLSKTLSRQIASALRAHPDGAISPPCSAAPSP